MPLNDIEHGSVADSSSERDTRYNLITVDIQYETKNIHRE